MRLMTWRVLSISPYLEVVRRALLVVAARVKFESKV